MAKGQKFILTIFWKDALPGVSPLRFGNCTKWRVAQRDGVPLILVRQEDGLRHEIPLDNILYWSVDPVVTNDSVGDPIFDRYCDSCKTYFDSGQFHGHPIATHDVRRTCCGSSPQHDHHPSCTQGSASSNQRIGTITDISEDDNGLNIEWKPFSPIHSLSDFLAKYDG